MALITFFLFSCEPAKGDFSFQTFRNRNSSRFTLLDSAREESDAEENPFLNSFIYHYFNNPVFYDQREDGKGALVSGIHSINVASEYSVNPKFSLGVEMPMYQLNYRGRGDTFALGDMRFFSKSRLSESLSLIPSVYLPTGNSTDLLSNPNGGAGLTLAAERQYGRVLMNVNAGADYFPGASGSGVSYAFQPYAGIGGSYSLNERWSVQLEGLSRIMGESTVGDLYAGGRLDLSNDRKLTFGASLANPSLGSSSMYRLMLEWMWSPGYTKVVTRKVVTKIETVKKVKTVLDCGPKPYSVQFAMRPLTTQEKREFLTHSALPYVSSSAHSIALLDPGVGMSVSEKNLSTVNNAQVVFAFDLTNLPPQNSVISVKNLDLLITVNKHWRSDDDRAGVICLLEQKICSGDLNQKNLSGNVNARFFEGKEPPNDYFVRQISAASPPGGKSVSKAKLRLTLEKLIENSVFPNTVELLYTGSKTLYFGVASDIYVSSRNLRLQVNMSIQACTPDKPKPEIETIEEKTKVLEEAPVNE